MKKILRLPDTLAMVQMSKSSWYKLINSGQAPDSINLGGRSVAWLLSDLENWIDERIALSNGSNNETI